MYLTPGLTPFSSEIKQRNYLQWWNNWWRLYSSSTSLCIQGRHRKLLFPIQDEKKQHTRCIYRKWRVSINGYILSKKKKKKHSMFLPFLVFSAGALFYTAFTAIIYTFENQELKANFSYFFPADHRSLIIELTEHWPFVVLACTFIPAVFYTLPSWNLYSRGASTFFAVISSCWFLHSPLLWADGDVCWLRGDGDLVLEPTEDIGLGVREDGICVFPHNAFFM